MNGLRVEGLEHDRVTSCAMLWSAFGRIVTTVLSVVTDVGRLASRALYSRAHLAAENVFLRKQLALSLERQVKLRRADDATRMTLVVLSRFVDWRRLLTVVQADTLIRWHLRSFRRS